MKTKLKKDLPLKKSKTRCLTTRCSLKCAIGDCTAHFTISSNAKRIFDHNRWKQSILLAAEHRWQDDRLTDGKPQGVFRSLKVRAVVFKSFENIVGRYCVTEEFKKEILTPTYSDQTMEEILKLSIRRRQRELDCVAAGKWNPVDRQERWTVDYSSPKDWMVD